ncbi:MAG: flagellar hook-associated protein FlgK [Alphaproteobacteria bacterium]|nr:flagellar hook-associated protein FlgK [Alphaproteobacteria bacterium]
MSINGILNTSISGLLTSQEALRNTSVNITNVNTPGYVRKVIQQRTQVVANGTGGVEIASIQRNIDAFLERESRLGSAQAERYKEMSALHAALQGSLGSPDLATGLGGRLNAIFTSLSDLGIEPDAAVRRFAVIDDLKSWGNEVTRLATEIQSYRADAEARVADYTLTINEELHKIHQLSLSIVRAKGSGQETSAIEEERARSIAEVAKYIDIRVIEKDNGFVTVDTVSGITLVDEIERNLVYTQTSTVTSASRFSQISVNKVNPVSGVVATTGQALDPVLYGGALRGLLDMRDTVLPNAAAQLGELARRVVDKLNEVHNDNVAMPPPTSLAGRNTGLLGTGPHNFTGTANFTLINTTSGAVARNVQVNFTAGTYAINGGAATAFSGTTLSAVVSDINTALGANGSLTFSAGVMTMTGSNGNGAAISQDATTPSSRGGRGFSHFFGMNDLMQANVAPHFDTGVASGDTHGFTAGGTISFEVRGPNNEVPSTYTYTVAAGTYANIVTALNTNLGTYATFSLGTNGNLVMTPTSSYSKYKIQVTNDTTAAGATNVTMSDFFGIGPKYQANAALSVDVVGRIGGSTTQTGNNALLAVGNVRSTTVGQTATGAADSNGVTDFIAMSIGTTSFAAAGDLSSTSASLADYTGAMLQRVALNAQTAKSFQEHRVALFDEISARRSAASGVNLDEELSNIVVFQNAYNASARMMTTAREMYDTLLALTGP